LEEENVSREAEMGAANEVSAKVLPISAKSPAALSMLANAYAAHLAQADQDTVSDIVYTASERRAHHQYRAAVVGRTRQELISMLSSVARGGLPGGATRGKTAEQRAPRIIFVFPGQGSQWLGMGRRLLAEEPAFRSALEACDRAIRDEAGFSVIEQLGAEEAISQMGEIDVVQPILFAMQVALAALWRSWGIHPDCVVGHSMGEVAAAYVAGMLRLDDAAKVICRRSRLLRRVSGKGAMALVELTMAEAEAAIVGRQDRLGVAVSNGPRSTVLSGEPEALDEVLGELALRGVFCRRVKVDVASHSPQVDPLLAELREQLGDVRSMEGRVPMRSTVTERQVAASELDGGYWVDNLRAPVRFSSVVRSLMGDGFSIFLEVSPHPILLPSVQENLQAANVAGATLPSLRRLMDERKTMLESLAELYVHGASVDWRQLNGGSRGRVVTLPSYPWQRSRYWYKRGAGPGAASTEGQSVDPAETTHADTRHWQEELAQSPVTRRRQLLAEAIAQHVAKVLGFGSSTDVDRDARFYDLGLDSLMAMQLARALGDLLHLRIPTTLIIEKPTISLLAEALADFDVGGYTPLVPLRVASQGRPFFCVHGIEGLALVFDKLAASMADLTPFYAFQAMGAEDALTPCDRLETMVSVYTAALRRVQPHGPYDLGGYSFGGLIAFEMARALVSQGESVSTLVLIDTPMFVSATRQGLPLLMAFARFAGLEVDEASLRALAQEEQEAVVAHSMSLRLGGEPSGIAISSRVVESHLRALRAYLPQPYAGGVELIRTSPRGRQTEFLPEDYGWGEFVTEARIHELPGDHYGLMVEPVVRSVARLLAKILKKESERE
jgi:thioesterase domain-containing protein/malonyl CoA-acyl carrier protein transacylase/acyl carrier protein